MWIARIIYQAKATTRRMRSKSPPDCTACDGFEKGVCGARLAIGGKMVRRPVIIEYQPWMRQPTIFLSWLPVMRDARASGKKASSKFQVNAILPHHVN